MIDPELYLQLEDARRRRELAIAQAMGQAGAQAGSSIAEALERKRQFDIQQSRFDAQIAKEAAAQQRHEEVLQRSLRNEERQMKKDAEEAENRKTDNELAAKKEERQRAETEARVVRDRQEDALKRDLPGISLIAYEDEAAKGAQLKASQKKGSTVPPPHTSVVAGTIQEIGEDDKPVGPLITSSSSPVVERLLRPDYGLDTKGAIAQGASVRAGIKEEERKDAKALEKENRNFARTLQLDKIRAERRAADLKAKVGPEAQKQMEMLKDQIGMQNSMAMRAYGIMNGGMMVPEATKKKAEEDYKTATKNRDALTAQLNGYIRALPGLSLEEMQLAQSVAGLSEDEPVVTTDTLPIPPPPKASSVPEPATKSQPVALPKSPSGKVPGKILKEQSEGVQERLKAKAATFTDEPDPNVRMQKALESENLWR